MGQDIVGSLWGVLLLLTLFCIDQKWKPKFKKILELEPYLTGETWFATGENFDTYHSTSGTRYIEARFARAARGLRAVAMDESILVHIPCVGSPRRGEAFLLRMRSPNDPAPPHYQNIGCRLFADPQGWSSAR